MLDDDDKNRRRHGTGGGDRFNRRTDMLWLQTDAGSTLLVPQGKAAEFMRTRGDELVAGSSSLARTMADRGAQGGHALPPSVARSGASDAAEGAAGRYGPKQKAWADGNGVVQQHRRMAPPPPSSSAFAASLARQQQLYDVAQAADRRRRPWEPQLAYPSSSAGGAQLPSRQGPTNANSALGAPPDVSAREVLVVPSASGKQPPPPSSLLPTARLPAPPQQSSAWMTASQREASSSSRRAEDQLASSSSDGIGRGDRDRQEIDDDNDVDPEVYVMRVWTTLLAMATMERFNVTWLVDPETNTTIVDKCRLWLEEQGRADPRLERVLPGALKDARAYTRLWEREFMDKIHLLREKENSHNRFGLNAQRALESTGTFIKSIVNDHVRVSASGWAEPAPALRSFYRQP